MNLERRMTELELKVACALRRRRWTVDRIARELRFSRQAVSYRLHQDARDHESELGPGERKFGRRRPMSLRGLTDGELLAELARRMRAK